MSWAGFANRVDTFSSSGSPAAVNVAQWGGTATSLGQKTMAASVPVAIASDQSAVPVQGPAASGALVSGNPVRVGGNDSGTTRDIIVDSSGRVIAVGAGTAGAPVGGVLSVQGVAGGTNLPANVAQWGGTATSLGQKTMAASVPVAIASDQSAVPVTLTGSSPSYVADTGTASTLNVKASAGVVKAFSVHNLNAVSTLYFQLHNTAGTPAGGAVPRIWWTVPPLSELTIGTEFFTTEGIAFSTGIAWAWSSTETTYTAAAAASQTNKVVYV